LAQNYSHEYSNFPSATIELTNYMDIDSTVAPIISRIYQLQSSGDYAGANDLIEENWELLKPYSVDMSALNRIIEEIYNTQLYALGSSQQIFISDTEPAVDVPEGSFWQQEY
jgi:hypothetical protein